VRKALAALIDSGWAFNVPNRGVVAARGLKPGESDAVAFIHRDDFEFHELGALLSDILDGNNLNLVHMASPTSQPMEPVFQAAASGNFRGALAWSYRGFPDDLELSKTCAQLPIIALDHRISATLDTDLVTFDHETAAYDATVSLAKLGCRRIGLTGMLDMLEITHQRICGYMRAMFACGLQPWPQDFTFSFTSGLDEHNTELLEHRLAGPTRPDGLLVLQDICVPAVAEAVDRMGYRLMRDLHLGAVGFDSSPEVRCRLSTVAVLDWKSMAHLAVDLLHKRLANLHQPPQIRTAPHSLFVFEESAKDHDSFTEISALASQETVSFPVLTKT
jgi:DNA-binding LacI/PurR family transcriptional regulator